MLISILLLTIINLIIIGRVAVRLRLENEIHLKYLKEILSRAKP